MAVPITKNTVPKTKNNGKQSFQEACAKCHTLQGVEEPSHPSFVSQDVLRKIAIQIRNKNTDLSNYLNPKLYAQIRAIQAFLTTHTKEMPPKEE